MSPSRKSPPSAIVGLDIGSDSIKVAEAKFGKDGITITGLGVARTPEGVFENEVITDPKALGTAIKALLNESGIKTKQVVSSVAGQSRVVVRVIEVPKMTPNELAETMKWEVERHVPFAPTDVMMDFQPLEKPNTDPDAQNMEVLLAVAQNELINTHVESLLAAGLKPVAIDIEPLAAGRSLIEISLNSKHENIVAIVNIGANNTDLGIYEEGLLTFPSPPLSIAGMSFTREISETLGKTLEEAETTKKEYASVKLSAFAPAPVDDQSAAAPVSPPEQTASEPTSFDMSVGPDMGFVSAFDFDAPAQPSEPVQPEPAPAESEQPEQSEPSGLAAEPAQLADFKTTIDGPVFDSENLVPSFDSAPSAGPNFDLGEPVDMAPAPDADAEQAEPPAPMMDFGGAEPAVFDTTPKFDLDDDEDVPKPEPQQLENPSFDLSDTDQHADPGELAPPPEPVQIISAPVASSGGAIQDQVFDAISAVLVDLANELRRSIEYYSNRYSQMPERIFLSGGTAKMPHLDEFLTEQLGIPVVVADPVKNLKMKITGMSDRYLHEISPMFSVSIGLAIRDMIE